jgi:hypothetical protein
MGRRRQPQRSRPVTTALGSGRTLGRRRHFPCRPGRHAYSARHGPGRWHVRVIGRRPSTSEPGGVFNAQRRGPVAWRRSTVCGRTSGSTTSGARPPGRQGFSSRRDRRDRILLTIQTTASTSPRGTTLMRLGRRFAPGTGLHAPRPVIYERWNNPGWEHRLTLLRGMPRPPT